MEEQDQMSQDDKLDTQIALIRQDLNHSRANKRLIITILIALISGVITQIGVWISWQSRTQTNMEHVIAEISEIKGIAQQAFTMSERRASEIYTAAQASEDRRVTSERILIIEKRLTSIEEDQKRKP